MIAGNDFNSFITFINNDLSKTPVNQLFLRINYNYQFKSHPELAEKNALTEQQVKKMVKTAAQHNIEIIPIINSIGIAQFHCVLLHWQVDLNNKYFPEFQL